MEVPESGACFAFGRSHLTISGDGNDNNYFFIKKDRIKRLICGRNQSGVICESGRLFVWGENPCGQLAIGTCENIVTKPSCVKHIKKLGHTVKDFHFGSNFSVLLTDSSQVFYAGKNVFPFNAKIESLEGKLQHDISEIPIELEEFSQLNDKFVAIRAGDEHFVVLNVRRDKLFGWGFNSHHQLATIDSYKVLSTPAVFFETEEGEPIKFLECGKLSTCVVTEFNDLYIAGRLGSTTISTFTRIREPVSNSTIIQLHISDDDQIYLVTECGLVFKSNNFRNIMELRFDEMKFPSNSEKIVKIAPGFNFVSILTESGKCFSLLNKESGLVESGKLKDLRVVDIHAGAQHVLVSAMLKDEPNESQDATLNQTYTINFKPIQGLGNGEENGENYHEPNTGEDVMNCEDITHDIGDKTSVIDLSDSTRGSGSRATTLECKDSQSSGCSSLHKLSPNRSDSTIRFIDNGIDKTLNVENTPDGKPRVGSVRIIVDEFSHEDEHSGIQRQKTPMPRARKSKNTGNEYDIDENDIIDRDEDLYNDDDDVSTSTMHGSDESLADYIKEENKINAEKSNGHMPDGKIKKLRNSMERVVKDIKDKGKGLSCRTADNVIGENEPYPQYSKANSRDHGKSCLIM